MSKICDRSPCDFLLSALGVWMFYSPQEGFFVTVSNGAADTMDCAVEYCPSCGTRLSEVGTSALEKFMRPRRRRRASKAVAPS